MPISYMDSLFSGWSSTFVNFCVFDHSPANWYFIVVLIDISMIVSDAEHSFRNLLITCTSFFWENITDLLSLWLPKYFYHFTFLVSKCKNGTVRKINICYVIMISTSACLKLMHFFITSCLKFYLKTPEK